MQNTAVGCAASSGAAYNIIVSLQLANERKTFRIYIKANERIYLFGLFSYITCDFIPLPTTDFLPQL